MILQAAADLGLDLPASAIVGDALSDIAAAAAAGVGLRILVGTARHTTTRQRITGSANLAEALAALRDATPPARW